MASKNKQFRESVNQFPHHKKQAKEKWMIRAHFKKRYEERTGEFLNKHKRKDLEQILLSKSNSKKKVLIEEQSQNRKLYKVFYKEKEIYIVWNIKLKELVTVLTEEMVNQRKERDLYVD